MVGIGGAIQSAMTAITGRSGGDNHQALLQALGMDQRQAALQGALQDLGAGNLAGYQKNLFEAFTGVDPGRLGAGMASSHHIGSPSSCMGARYDRMDLKKFTKGGLGAMLGGFALGGPLGALIGRNLSKRGKAKALERRLNRDPLFRAQFEASVGGRYVPDFRNDGKITVARNNFGLPGLNPGIFGALGGNPIAGSALSGLARMMGNAAGLMQGLSAGGSGIGGDALTRKAEPGSFMSKLGPNPSFEDIVAAFMMDTVKHQQEQMKKLMSEIDEKQRAKSDDGGGRRGYGGALGGIAGMAGGVLGGMVGGPVGAAVGKGLGGAVGNAVGGQGSTAQGDETGNSEALMMEKLKQMMNNLQQMQQALSNVLNAMHQGAMNAVRNIRG